MRCGEEIGLFTSSVMWAVWAEEEYLTHHTRRKYNFDRLLCIVFFITQIRFISVNEEASRVKFGKKFWKKKFWKQILEKKFWEKILEKKFWEKNFGNKF